MHRAIVLLAALLLAPQAYAQPPAPNMGVPVTAAGTSTAPLTKSGYGLLGKLNGETTYTPSSIAGCIISGCSAPVMPEGVTGIAINTSGSTAPFITSGVAGYVVNKQPHSGAAAVSAAVNAMSICAVDNAACWGVNSLQTDNPAGMAVSGGVGRSLYNEFDLNVTSTGTVGAGLNLGGTWLVANNNINAFGVTTPWGACGTNPCAPFAKWANGFITSDGAATVGINLGLVNYTPAPTQGSQPLYFSWTDASSVRQAVFFQANGTGDINLNSSTASSGNLILNKGGLYLPSNQGLEINGHVAISADTGANAYITTDASFTSINVGNSSAQISLNGPAKLKALTVAALPTCTAPLNGSMMSVTDATAPTYNGTLTGGGSVHIPVFCNGTNWTAH